MAIMGNCPDVILMLMKKSERRKLDNNKVNAMIEANSELDKKILDEYDTLQVNAKSLVDKSVSMYQMGINLSFYDIKRAHFIMNYHHEIKDRLDTIKQKFQYTNMELTQLNQHLNQAANKDEYLSWENINNKKNNISQNLAVVDKYLMWTYSTLLENNIYGYINKLTNVTKSLNLSLPRVTPFISE
jgi:hypothetical protein